MAMTKGKRESKRKPQPKGMSEAEKMMRGR
jgi:hypothetical protein